MDEIARRYFRVDSLFVGAAVGVLCFGLLVCSGEATAEAAPAVSPLPTPIVKEFPIWPAAAPGTENAPGQEQVSGPAADRSISHVSRPTVIAFFASKPNGAAILVVPGGGYTKVMIDKEGTEIAHWLNTLGVDAYVLKYRLPLEEFNSTDVAFQDGQRALRMIRANVFGGSFSRHTDPKRVGVIGFSVGGHLAGVLSTYYDRKFYDAVDAADAVSARPDFMILGYASIFQRSEIGWSLWNRFWAVAGPYPFDTALTAKTPPTFVFVGGGDTRLPFDRALRTADMLRNAGVPVELHVFTGAPHGFGLRGTGPEKAWPGLCAAWMRARGVIPR